jgi:phage protein D
MQPFYIFQVLDNQGKITEITEYIDSFTFEDCLKEDDLVKFSLMTDDTKLVDADWLKVGYEIRFKFGYLDGLQSAERRAIITDITAAFGQMITVDVISLDKGFAIKKTQSSKIWRKQTASQIAETIAEYYNLKAVTDKTDFVYNSIPQGNHTDFEFLKYLATQEKNGQFHFFIKDNELHFTKINLLKEAARLYTYKNPDSGILSLRFHYQETHQDKGQSLQTTARQFNPLTGEYKEVNANIFTAKDGQSLGDFATSLLKDVESKIDSRGATTIKKQSNNEQKKSNTGEFVLVPPTMDTSRVQNLVMNQHKTAKNKEISCSLTLEGDPTLKADEIITVANVGEKFGGNYHIIKVTHKISSSGFISTLEMQKNASKKPIHAGAVKISANQDTKINTSKGKTSAPANVREIKKYDANSNEVR